MRKVLLALLIVVVAAANVSGAKKKTDREIWVDNAYTMSYPLLKALSEDKLFATMPVEEKKGANRGAYTHLEGVGRLVCGIAPWLELPADNTPEGKKREELLALLHKGIANGVNPEAKDYLNFGRVKGGQPLVDAAFLAQGFLRAPKRVWGELDQTTKDRVIKEMSYVLKIKPGNSNWQMFAATVETFLLKTTGKCDMFKVHRAFGRLNSWYVGDGEYSDGPVYHKDYYASFVMHPMLLDCGKELVETYNHPDSVLFNQAAFNRNIQRATRYAATLERSISPEGTFPVVGRSILYRTGAMQVLSQISLWKKLPKDVSEGQVRAALTLVLQNMLEAKGTYDKNGWLTLGFCGAQPLAGETYVSTGSLYLASFIFLPLGLDASDSFWTSKEQEWTSKLAWGGKSFKIDKAVNLKTK